MCHGGPQDGIEFEVDQQYRLDQVVRIPVVPKLLVVSPNKPWTDMAGIAFDEYTATENFSNGCQVVIWNKPL